MGFMNESHCGGPLAFAEFAEAKEAVRLESPSPVR